MALRSRPALAACATFSVLGLSCGRPSAAAHPSELPGNVIPVGYDAYRYWDHWPYLRLGMRAYMRSTADPNGGNSDASNFLRQDAAGSFVTLEVAGNGMLTFVRTNHWHGSPWHYIVDGNDRIVAESATEDPSKPVPNSTFLPAEGFPPPLALTWSRTAGADLSWIPVPFQSSLELAYGRAHYGTGYYIYDLFAPGASNLSQPPATWSAGPPPADVLELLDLAGADLAPTGQGVRTTQGTLDLPAGAIRPVADLTGPAAVRALELTAPAASAIALGRARLRITWDGRARPSIDTPVALFFGAGTLFNRDGREFLVRAFPVVVRFTSGNVVLATYLPMPFFRSAHIELEGGDVGVPELTFRIRTVPYEDPARWAGYLHATYHDQGTPVPGQDLVLLDTRDDEGGGDWCGHVVGTSFTFSDRGDLVTLEGDPRFFFDDSLTPQAQGTGTEEWGGGGDYWLDGRRTSLPLAGHPVGVGRGETPLSAEDRIESAYRFLLADLFPFGFRARLQLEHGATDDSTEHYRTLAYWYGLPGACLVLTDALHVSDAADEAAHRYVSAIASAPEMLTSRYEWGADHIGTAETYAATADTGRHTTGASEFTLAIDPENSGVLLRRKLDYGWPDQRAAVSVADDVPGAPFLDAGAWYLAGGSAYLHDDPPTETGVAPPEIRVSGHRWREDEFLLPPALTAGRARIRVRLSFTPTRRALEPGAPPPDQAWSEFRYWAYSFRAPPEP
jgi:hypothetical protein